MAEFGEPGADAGQVIDGPLNDPAARRDLAPGAPADRGPAREAVTVLRAPVRRRRIDARRLGLADLAKIPVTLKARPGRAAGRLPVRRRPPLSGDAHHRYTGKPAEIWLSRYEMELWPALGALAGCDPWRTHALRRPPVNVSSRATGSVHLRRGRVPPGRRGCRVRRHHTAGRSARRPDQRQRDAARPSRATSVSSWSPPAGEGCGPTISGPEASTSAARCSRGAWPGRSARPSAANGSRTFG